MRLLVTIPTAESSLAVVGTAFIHPPGALDSILPPGNREEWGGSLAETPPVVVSIGRHVGPSTGEAVAVSGASEGCRACALSLEVLHVVALPAVAARNTADEVLDVAADVGPRVVTLQRASPSRVGDSLTGWWRCLVGLDGSGVWLEVVCGGASTLGARRRGGAGSHAR